MYCLSGTLAFHLDTLRIQARRPHNSPAHTVKDRFAEPVFLPIPSGRFVRGEPPILHRFQSPSTPFVKLYFGVLVKPGSPQRRAFIAAEEKNSATCAGWEEGVTEIFHIRLETP